MKAGSAFYIQPEGRRLDEHLWIVASDPSVNPNHVLIVSMTSWKEDGSRILDPACVLMPGDHPRVKHKSFLAYSMAKVLSLDELTVLSSHLDMQPDVSHGLLARIREGAANSIHIKMEHAEILLNQGLIEF